MIIKAYTAKLAVAPLQPFEYDPGAIGPEEVAIAVSHCGICHSDLSMLNNDWEITQYPFVPGHHRHCAGFRRTPGHRAADRNLPPVPGQRGHGTIALGPAALPHCSRK